MSAGLCRNGSLCAPDDLRQLLDKSRLEAFRAALDSGRDPNSAYGEPDFASILDLACQRDRGGEFVRALLRAGADRNRVNKTRDRTPLHFALEFSNVEALKALLEEPPPGEPPLDLNIVNSFGNNALHVICQKKYSQDVGECLEILLSRSDLDVNHTNRKGQTPIFLAATKSSEEIVKILLDHRVKVDVDKTYNDKTARQVILERFPSLENEIAKIPTAKKDHKLMDCVYRQDEDGFISLLSEEMSQNSNTKIVDADDGLGTLLQQACECGLEKVVEALLKEGANPNLTTESKAILPAQIAARQGHYHMLQRLLENNAQTVTIDGKTALHYNMEYADPDSPKFPNHVKCFDLLLKHTVDDINCADQNGFTPLHVAVSLGHEDFILKLLENGAYIGAKDRLGVPPVAALSPGTLKRFLDSCIKSEKSPRHNDYKITFDVSFLRPNTEPHPHSNNNDVNIPIADMYPNGPQKCECEPLLDISKIKDLRSLLNHPVVTSFLELKWRGIRPFFWANLIFYVIFVFFITLYILFFYEYPADSLDEPSTENPVIKESPLNSTEEKETTATTEISTCSKVVWFIVLIHFVILLIREIFQLVVAPRHYIRSLENYLEIFLLISCALVLFYQSAGVHVRPHLSAIAILLSWAELVLLIGRHPRLSTNIEMLKTVSMNFLQFLAWYSLLIVAFALSFYTLFRGSKEEDNFFLNPGSSFFKTVVMITGEFDAGDLPFVMFPGTSHIVFVLFVFLVAIVLFNLLNGLAVSDTQAIREDAELVSIVSRIKLVSYTEEVLLSHPFWCQGCLSNDCCMFQAFTGLQKLSLSSLTTCVQKVRLFPSVLPDGKISVLPNQESKIVLDGSDHKSDDAIACYSPLNCYYYLEKSIIKSAEKILEAQSLQSNSNLEKCMHNNKVTELETKLSKLEESMYENQKVLEKILLIVEQSRTAHPF